MLTNSPQKRMSNDEVARIINRINLNLMKLDKITDAQRLAVVDNLMTSTCAQMVRQFAGDPRADRREILSVALMERVEQMIAGVMAGFDQLDLIITERNREAKDEPREAGRPTPSPIIMLDPRPGDGSVRHLLGPDGSPLRDTG